VLFYRIKLFAFVFFLAPPLAIALDAQENGQWLSMGSPAYFHMGTDGRMFVTGSNHGSCAGIKPNYFRFDMSEPHFKEFYSWMLMASTTGKTFDCVVDKGCGSAQVWTRYCRGSIK
jgi:hypothetical protein